MGEKLSPLQEKVLPYTDRRLSYILADLFKTKQEHPLSYVRSLSDALFYIKTKPLVNAFIKSRTDSFFRYDPFSGPKLLSYQEGFAQGLLVLQRLNSRKRVRLKKPPFDNSPLPILPAIDAFYGINGNSENETLDVARLGKISTQFPKTYAVLQRHTFPQVAYGIGFTEALMLYKDRASKKRNK